MSRSYPQSLKIPAFFKKLFKDGDRQTTFEPLRSEENASSGHFDDNSKDSLGEDDNGGNNLVGGGGGKKLSSHHPTLQPPQTTLHCLPQSTPQSPQSTPQSTLQPLQSTLYRPPQQTITNPFKLPKAVHIEDKSLYRSEDWIELSSKNQYNLDNSIGNLMGMASDEGWMVEKENEDRLVSYGRIETQKDILKDGEMNDEVVMNEKKIDWWMDGGEMKDDRMGNEEREEMDGGNKINATHAFVNLSSVMQVGIIIFIVFFFYFHYSYFFRYYFYNLYY